MTTSPSDHPVISLTDAEIEALKALEDSYPMTDASIRARAILTLYETQHVPTTAKTLYVTPGTIYNWRRSWRLEGIAGLETDETYTVTYSPLVLKHLIAFFMANGQPQDYDLPARQWYVAYLQGLIHHVTGYHPPAKHLKRLLWQMGWYNDPLCERHPLLKKGATREEIRTAMADIVQDSPMFKKMYDDILAEKDDWYETHDDEDYDLYEGEDF
ncbi:MAG: helix-turn-helix domain-containing protein [Chloroflexota bacterium]